MARMLFLPVLFALPFSRWWDSKKRRLGGVCINAMRYYVTYRVAPIGPKLTRQRKSLSVSKCARSRLGRRLILTANAPVWQRHTWSCKCALVEEQQRFLLQINKIIGSQAGHGSSPTLK